MLSYLHVIHKSNLLARQLKLLGTSPINSDSRVHLAPHPGSHQLPYKFFSKFLGGL